MDLFVPANTGTYHTQRFVVNPLFILLINAQAQSFQRLLEIFGVRPREGEHNDIS